MPVHRYSSRHSVALPGHRVLGEQHDVSKTSAGKSQYFVMDAFAKWLIDDEAFASTGETALKTVKLLEDIKRELG